MKTKKMLTFLVACLLVITATLGTACAATSTEDIIAAMDANSAAWFDADAETRKQLEAENAAYRQQLAEAGAEVTYDPVAGTTTVTGSEYTYTNTGSNGTQAGYTSTTTNTTTGTTTVVQTTGGSTVVNAAGHTTEVTYLMSFVYDSSGEYIGVGYTDTLYVTDGDTVAVGSQAMTEARAALIAQGIEPTEYNIAAYLNEHYTGMAYSIAAETEGCTTTYVDSHGRVITEVSITGISQKEDLIKYIAVGLASGESFDETWAGIEAIETSPEMMALKKKYAEIQALTDDLIDPEEKRALLDDLHAQAEAIRAEYGYSGGSDGGYYIPIETTTGSGPITIAVTNPDPDPTPNPNPNPNPTPDDGDDDNVFTFWPITVTHSAGGTVTPGSGAFLEHSDATFTFSCNTGYQVKSVIVDGVNVGASNQYTFVDVTASHTLHVVFGPKNPTISGGLASDSMSKDGTIKSGYGVTSDLAVDTHGFENVDVSVTASWDFGSGNSGTVVLEKSSGKWVFPVNSASKVGARKIYIPVETKDGTYTVTFNVVVKYYDESGELIDTIEKNFTSTIVVKGSMYEDDFTGDNR